MSRYNYDNLRGNIEKELKNETMPENLYKSVDSVSRILMSIIDTGGEGWAAQALNDNGQPIFNEEEQKRFTEVFEPHIQSIIGFMGNKTRNETRNEIPNKMSGGELDTNTSTTTQNKPICPPVNGAIEPTFDGLFYGIVNKINEIDKVFNNMGIIRKFENDNDLLPDPKPLLPLIAIPGFGILGQVPVSYRFITFLVYLALDLGRISISSSGNIAGRKIMTIILALYEFLRGDWKKSILTMIGFYTQNNLMLGEMLKIYLSMFRKLNPKIQESIIYGTLDSVKSFVVGLLLSIFKVTSPLEVRRPIIEAFQKIEEKKGKRDKQIGEAGLLPRPDYLIPTFEDLNNVQALMTDGAFICSCQFIDLIDALEKSTTLKIVLEIMGIPIIKEAKERKCPQPCPDMNRDICTTFAEQAINDNNESELRQKPGSGQARAETEEKAEEEGQAGAETKETTEQAGQGTKETTKEEKAEEENTGQGQGTKLKHPKVEIKPRVKLSQGGRQLRRNSNSRKFMDK